MNVNVMVRVAHAAVLCSLAILATAPTPVDPANDVLPATARPIYEVSVAGQVKDFDCTLAPKGVWPSSALVVKSKRIAGGVQNGSIVRAESFDVAFAHAKAGTVWIIRWCK